ncbi:MAG TPA: hypothetical protein VM434_15580 [Beijerinckiaceae bacterium]|nr:hypothetical protein [Beijerinckiaceae bacterium]
MHAYNLFRRKGDTDLFCAVPEECAVPGFLQGRSWEFSGRLSEPRSAPIGFDARAATTGVRLNGFYLFQSFPKH